MNAVASNGHPKCTGMVSYYHLMKCLHNKRESGEACFMDAQLLKGGTPSCHVPKNAFCSCGGVGGASFIGRAVTVQESAPSIKKYPILVKPG
jgi:hypothetical protein